MSIYIEHEYVPVTCGADGCDQAFAMSRRFYDATHRDGRTWYCPSGHPRVWRGETTEQKLHAAQARNQHLEDQIEAAGREAEAIRAALVRDRHRFANGVCPCCNRSFDNVAHHMRAQHPDYDLATIKGAATPAFTCSCGQRFDSYRGLRTHQGRMRSDDWAESRTSRWRAHLTVAEA